MPMYRAVLAATAVALSTLFSEVSRRHVIPLRRVQGLVLHKWVVTRIG